jgi:hypothetical protein
VIPCPSPLRSRPIPLLLTTLPAGEILATPRAKVLRPSLCELPVASLRLPPQLLTAGKSHCRRGVASSCCVGRSLSLPLHHHDASAKHPMTMPRATSLLPPPLLELSAAPSSLQLPISTPRRHHALACPRVPHGHHHPPLSSSPPHHQRKDKNPFSVASTPAPTIAALAALCTARAHAHSAATPSQAITSSPLSWRSL